MSATARAFWIEQAQQGVIRQEALDARTPDQVLVQTLFSGISRGTESLVFQGRVPASQYVTMRAPFQAGAFPFPVKYGYSNVGKVLEGSDELLDKIVFCLYPHQTHYRVPATAVMPLPAGLPPARAVLAANMETAVNGVWDLAPLLGEQIAVVGAGTLGCLVARLCRMPGGRVMLIDTDSTKAALAQRLGVDFAPPVADLGPFDKLVHTSANPAGLNWALAHAGPEATIIELSWYGDRNVALSLGENFHSRRLTLRSSQVSTIAPVQNRRWDYQRRRRLALELLCDPVFDTLISGEDEFSALPEVMQTLSRQPQGVLCHRIRYPQE